MILSFREKFSSRIDYPQEDLPKDLWDKVNGEYVLKPNVVVAIKNMADSVLSVKFKKIEDWVVTFVLGSSIATQFWKADSDLDIKIVIDSDKFKSANPEYSDSTDTQLKEQFLEVFDQHKGKEYFKYNQRPMDMYLAIDKDIYTKDFQKRFDALYDVISKRWIKNPTMYDVDTYDRAEIIEDGEISAMNWAEKWDLDFGKIRRKVKEAELLENYIKTLTVKKAKRFKQKLENLLFVLEQEIKKLHKEKDYVKQKYYQSYDTFNENLENYYKSVNELPEVICIKLLNLWGYLYIIKKLNDIIKDDHKISIDEITDINTAIKN